MSQHSSGIPAGTLVGGRYETRRRIGGGGQAEVLEAADRTTGRPVAVKLWPAGDPEAAADQARELRSLVGLAHPGLVEVLDAGSDSDLGRPYLVMELVRGADLLAAWREASEGQRELIVLRLAEALAALHHGGLLHGDLKPWNILVRAGTDGPQPVIVDFGMAERRHEAGFRGGTPAYLAPEVAQGGRPEFRSDLYALGLSLLQAALGQDRPRRSIPRDASLPPFLARVLPRLLNRRPERRYADADALLAALRRVAGGRAIGLAWDRLPFRGRDAVLEELVGHAAALPVSGSPPVARGITGEPGSGRRRLLQEVVLRARAQGVRAATWSEETTLPDLLRQLAEHLEGEAREALGRGLPMREGPGLGPDPASRLAAVTARHLPGRGLLLAGPMDAAGDPDLHRFLRSLVSLEAAARGLGRGPRLLVLVAGDPDQVALPGAPPPVRTDPLDEQAVLEILRDTLGLRRTGDTLRRAATLLHRLSGGLPLALQEALKRAWEAGLLRMEGEVLHLEGRALEGMELPAGLSAIVLARWRRLSDRARRMLLLVATAEKPPSREELTDLPETAATEDVLAEARASGLVDSTAGPEGPRYRLRPAEAARLLLAEAGPAAVQAAHRTWMAVCRDGARVRHGAAAGDPGVAAEIIPEVERLAARGESRRAQELAGNARRRLSFPASEARRLDLLEGRLLLLQGRLSEAEVRLRKLLEAPEGGTAAAAAAQLCDLALARGLTQEAEAHARQAVAAAGDGPAGRRAAAVLAFVQLRAGRLQEARNLAQETVARDAAPDVRGQALNVLGLSELRLGDRQAGRVHLEQAAEAFQEAGDRTALASVQVNLALLHSRTGERPRALSLLQDALAAFSEAGLVAHRANALNNLAVMEGLEGRPLDAAAGHEEARVLYEAIGQPERAAAAQASHGIALFRAGRPQLARRRLKRALLGRRSLRYARGRVLAWSALAEVEAQLGRYAASRRHAARALREARSLGSTPEMARACEAAAVARTGTAAAARWARRSVERLSPDGDPDARARALLVLAEARLSAGAPAGSLEAPPGGAAAEEPRRRHLAATMASEAGTRRRHLVRGLLSARSAGNLLWEMRLQLLAVGLALEEDRPRRARLSYRRALALLSELEEDMSARESALFRLANLRREIQGVMDAAELRLQALDRSRESSMALEMTELLHLLGALNAEDTLPRLLARIVESALRLLGGEKGFVVLREGPGEIEFAVARTAAGRRIKMPRNKVSTSIVHEVLGTGRSLVVGDALEDDRYQNLVSVARSRIRSLMCVPLRRGARTTGVLYLDAGDRRGAFGEEQLPLAEAFADLAALAIRRLMQHDTEKERLEEELRTRRSALRAMRHEVKRAREEAGAELLGDSQPMRELRKLVERAGRSDVPVLVTGESGSGKELVARMVHERSPRADGPFVTQSCAAIPAKLFESELFGHVKGAFTGATEDKTGLVFLADRGTLFLDEVGELPLEAQAKLLRCLQEGEARPVGAEAPRPFDARVVAATNRDLREMVESGAFREDLYFRLKVIEIAVAPLREHPADIPRLVERFLERWPHVKGCSARALAALQHYRWPGNVRQLKNEVDRAAALSSGPRLEAGALSPEVLALERRPPTLVGPDGAPLPLKEAEERLLAYALAYARNDRQKAARLLGISRSTLYERLKRQGRA